LRWKFLKIGNSEKMVENVVSLKMVFPAGISQT
jgi:hypothetical protein